MRTVLTHFMIADNLAWKISDVLKGVSRDPERLLNSYNLEVHHKAAAHTLFIQHLQFYRDTLLLKLHSERQVTPTMLVLLETNLLDMWPLWLHLRL